MSAANALVSLELQRQKANQQGWNQLNKAILSIAQTIELDRRNRLIQELSDYYKQGQEIPNEVVADLSKKYRIPLPDVLKVTNALNQNIEKQKVKLAGSMLYDLVQKKGGQLDPQDLLTVGETLGLSPEKMRNFVVLGKTFLDYLEAKGKHKALPPEILQAFGKRVGAKLPQGTTYGQATQVKSLLGTLRQPTVGYRAVWWYNPSVKGKGRYIQSPTYPGEGYVPYEKPTTKGATSDPELRRVKMFKSIYVQVLNRLEQELPPGASTMSEEEKLKRAQDIAIKIYQKAYPGEPLPKKLQAGEQLPQKPASALDWIQSKGFKLTPQAP